MWWKLCFVFYVVLVSPEIAVDAFFGTGVLLCILKATFSVAFAFPLFCFSFDKALVSTKFAAAIFYVCVFRWVYIRAGTGDSIESLIMAAFVVVLYAPGFIAINRYKRRVIA